MPIVGAHSTGFFFRKWLFHDFFASDSRRVDDFCELSQCAYSTESNVHRRTKGIASYTRQTQFPFAAAPHHTRINGVLISNWKYHGVTNTLPAPGLISCETF